MKHLKLSFSTFLIASAFLLGGCYTQVALNDNYNDDQDSSPEITIIDYGPAYPIIVPIVGIPSPIIVRPPVHPQTPIKKVDNDKSQNIRPRDNTNNNSNKARNDNGSRNNDNGRGR